MRAGSIRRTRLESRLGTRLKSRLGRPWFHHGRRDLYSTVIAWRSHAMPSSDFNRVNARHNWGH
jgi:hypothetical protein